MKKLLFIACLFLGFIYAATAQKELSAKERQDAIKFYNDATNTLQQQIKGLSEAQLNWKPNDSTWSIANCVEHISLSENNIFDWAMSTLKSPADAAKRSEIKLSDEQVKSMVENRETKRKTFDALQPKGQFGNTAKTMEEFLKRRGNVINYIETTKDDLRDHVSQTPLGMLDTYQMVLFLNAHTIRHTAQIIELKSMAGFPKS